MGTHKSGKSKIGPFVAAMEKVINYQHPVGRAIIWTDEQLLEQINGLLPEEEQITSRTFQMYKAGELKRHEALDAFLSLYKKSLHRQAETLFEKLEEGDPGSWQKYAWLIERKFDAWNLRRKEVDETPDVRRLVFVDKVGG